MTFYRNTSYLYYREYPYKLVLNARWSCCAKELTLEVFESIAKSKKEPIYHSHRQAWHHKANVKKLLTILDSYDRSQIRMRSEGVSLSIFLKDRKLIDDLVKAFPEECYAVYEPAGGVVEDYLLSNQKTIVKKKLIHGCRYKIYFKNPKTPLSETERKAISNVIKNNKDKFANVGRHLRVFLDDPSRRWLTQDYIYIKEDKSLLMFQLIANPIIKETVTIVTEDEIKQKENENV